MWVNLSSRLAPRPRSPSSSTHPKGIFRSLKGANAHNGLVMKHLFCVALAITSFGLTQNSVYVDNLRAFSQVCLQYENLSWSPEHNERLESLVETLINKAKDIYGLPMLDSCPWPLPPTVLFLNLQVISNYEVLRVDLQGRLQLVVDSERSTSIAWPIIWMRNGLHPFALKSDVAGSEIERLAGFLLEAFSKDFHLSRQ